MTLLGSYGRTHPRSGNPRPQLRPRDGSSRRRLFAGGSTSRRPTTVKIFFNLGAGTTCFEYSSTDKPSGPGARRDPSGFGTTRESGTSPLETVVSWSKISTKRKRDHEDDEDSSSVRADSGSSTSKR
ncbi:hypothetical protein OQA88_6046 [Cercophora sp. LCS_1]